MNKGFGILVKTLWAACRAVVFGAIVIVVGMLMTVVGYFDVDLAQEERYNKETDEKEIVINLSKRYQLKSLQYVGPILMGVGSFILIIACVITLESRDKHAQIIHEESKELRKKQSANMHAEEFATSAQTTTTEIHHWKPKYLQLPRIDSSDSKRRVAFKIHRSYRFWQPETCLDSSTSAFVVFDESCHYMMKCSNFLDLIATTTRKLYHRLMEDYYNEMYHETPKNDSKRDECFSTPNDNRCKRDSTQQSVVAEVHVRPRSSLGSSSSVFTSPPPLSGTKTAHAEDVNRRTLSSAAALSVASIGAESANTSTTTRQAFSVDLPTTEKMPSAVLRMAHPKTAHLTPLDVRTAPIAQTDTDLYMSSSCSSLDVSKAPGSSRQLSETLAHSCTLPNGTEMR
uniref:Transmembrane protein 200B n=1 Tax=Ascaris lumbricoides TaxID=6252 RepID=A0A9J2P0N8_ASCLU